MIALPDAEAAALADGLVVAALVDRGTVTPGEEVELAAVPSGGLEEIRPEYRRLAGRSLGREPFTAIVEAVHPAASLDPTAGAGGHVWLTPGGDDLVVLRVYGPAGPVLDDARFAALRAVLEGALRT